MANLAPDEPLSPELVLVLPPELRSQVLGRLGPPAWARSRRPCCPEVSASHQEPFPRWLGKMVARRVVQLAVVFAAVTLATLAMSVVAAAVR